MLGISHTLLKEWFLEVKSNKFNFTILNVGKEFFYFSNSFSILRLIWIL